MRKLLFATAFSTALLSMSVGRLDAFVLTPLDHDTVSVEVGTRGKTHEEALAKARLEAVRACVGRVYLEGKLTCADQLLAKYLEQYAPQFVKSEQILDEGFHAGGTDLQARVYVKYSTLINDLQEKRFLFEPASKPRFAAFVSETLDGKAVTTGNARDAVKKALNKEGLAPHDGDIATPPSTSDIGADEILLESGIVSSQRSGVEVIVSGKATISLREKRQLYLETYFFYDCELTARLVRVDTGETLFEAKSFGSASDKDGEVAVRNALTRASERVAKDLSGRFEKLWPVLVQEKADYEVLLTGVDAETLRIVSQHLERMSPSTKVYLRKRFDRSAVLSVSHSGSRQDLLDALGRCTYPTLSVINPNEPRKFEVQVSG